MARFRYIVESATPISAEEVDGGGGGLHPEHPWVPPGAGIWPSPGRPEHPIVLPPPSVWPPLPPDLEVGLPLPPTPEHPIVPLPPEVDPPAIWPPIRPELPDFEGKTLALALVFVSRTVAKLHWVVIDNEEAKEKFKEMVSKVKDKIPAGGVGGRPPQRPEPHR